MMAEAGGDAMFRLLALLPERSRAGVVRLYLQSLATQLDALHAALAERDWPAAEALAHKLSGSAGMMHDEPLCRAGRRVEDALRAGRPADASAALPELQACAGATVAVLGAAYPAAA